MPGAKLSSDTSRRANLQPVASGSAGIKARL